MKPEHYVLAQTDGVVPDMWIFDTPEERDKLERDLKKRNPSLSTYRGESYQGQVYWEKPKFPGR